MRVLLNEVGSIKDFFEKSDDFGTATTDYSNSTAKKGPSFFEDVKAIERFDTDSELYRSIEDIEKKLNWLEYKKVNGTYCARPKYRRFDEYGYISVLNSYLRLGDNRIILLLFPHIINMDKQYSRAMNRAFCPYICARVEEFERIVKEELDKDKTGFEDSMRYFEETFDEDDFNDRIFKNRIFKTKQGEYGRFLKIQFVRELTEAYQFGNMDTYHSVINRACASGFLDLSMIPCLRGMVYEIPAVKDNDAIPVKIVDVKRDALLDVNIRNIENVDAGVEVKTTVKSVDEVKGVVQVIH